MIKTKKKKKIKVEKQQNGGVNMNDFASEIAKQKAKQANSKPGSRNTNISVSMSGEPVIKLKRNKESQVLLTEKQLIEMQKLLEEQVCVKMNAELEKLRTKYRVELRSLKDDLEESQDRYLQMSSELETERKKILLLNSKINVLSDNKVSSESCIESHSNEIKELKLELENEKQNNNT